MDFDFEGMCNMAQLSFKRFITVAVFCILKWRSELVFFETTFGILSVVLLFLTRFYPKRCGSRLHLKADLHHRQGRACHRRLVL